MTDRPILFSGEMVRAILDGRKTVTRRPVKPLVEWIAGRNDDRNDPGNWGVADENGAWVTLDQSLPPYRGKGASIGSESYAMNCPFGAPGDRLWVRETWGLCAPWDSTSWFKGSVGGRDEMTLQWQVEHRADWGTNQEGCHWRPSIHMPRWASRLTLEVTSVGVERLRAVTRKEAIAEGVQPSETSDGDHSYHLGFIDTWDRIYAIEGLGWDDNPWVWRVGFRRVE